MRVCVCLNTVDFFRSSSEDVRVFLLFFLCLFQDSEESTLY